MKRLLFGIAMLLLVVWIFGFFIFNAGTIIHLSVIVAAIACMQAIIITSPKSTGVVDRSAS